jgi:hypothetical protein
MIASVCGQGALLAVEKKIRGEVAFKLKEENIRKDASRYVCLVNFHCLFICRLP